MSSINPVSGLSFNTAHQLNINMAHLLKIGSDKVLDLNRELKEVRVENDDIKQENERLKAEKAEYEGTRLDLIRHRDEAQAAAKELEKATSSGASGTTKQALRKAASWKLKYENSVIDLKEKGEEMEVLQQKYKDLKAQNDRFRAADEISHHNFEKFSAAYQKITKAIKADDEGNILVAPPVAPPRDASKDVHIGVQCDLLNDPPARPQMQSIATQTEFAEPVPEIQYVTLTAERPEMHDMGTQMSPQPSPTLGPIIVTPERPEMRDVGTQMRPRPSPTLDPVTDTPMRPEMHSIGIQTTPLPSLTIAPVADTPKREDNHSIGVQSDPTPVPTPEVQYITIREPCNHSFLQTSFLYSVILLLLFLLLSSQNAIWRSQPGAFGYGGPPVDNSLTRMHARLASYALKKAGGPWPVYM
ncbi:hypothetical protein EJ08DRAFT_185347 [Tothia fuscella]|uniref:Uncharacterized protein n=1 Tax=Tothia fuscella TaxID=1048955 RepID=A0A9P4NTH2_9PEZI|nr:hypothetical protein EJ08DRAFT_185347 [Tothia fuscella]